jgi:hypothetical protein
VPLLGAEMVHSCVNAMSELYARAMAEHPPLVVADPFSGLDLPEIPPRPVEFYEHAEAEQLYATVEARPGATGGRSSSWACTSACGPGEIYGLHAVSTGRAASRTSPTS